MPTLMDLLNKYILGGVPDVGYDLLKKIWKEVNHRDWEELYLHAFRSAFADMRSQLRRHGENATLRQDQIRKALHENLTVSISDVSLSRMSGDEFAKNLARAMADRNVIEIGGNNLSNDDYLQLTSNLVHRARANFKESITRNEEAFREAILAEEQQNWEAIDGLIEYLRNRYDLILVQLDQIEEIQEQQIDILKKVAQFPTACISTSGAEMLAFEQAAAHVLTEMGYRVVKLNLIMARYLPARQAVEREIRNCDLVIGIYGPRYGPTQSEASGAVISWAAWMMQYALNQCRRSICFVSSDQLSASLAPEPKREEEKPPPECWSLIQELGELPRPYRAPKGFSLILTRFRAWLRKEESPTNREHRETWEYNKNRKDVETWQAEKRRIDEDFENRKDIFRDETRPQIEFLSELRQDFQLHEFSDEVALRQQLHTLIKAFEDSTLVGYSCRRVGTLWKEWGRTQAALIQKKELCHRPLLRSPLEDHFKPFLQYDWLARVQALVSEIEILAKETSTKHPQLAEAVSLLAQAPKGIFSENWEELVVRLKNWCSGKLLSRLRDRLGELIVEEQMAVSKDHDRIALLEKSIEEWEATTRDYFRELSAPSYGRCLLLLGRAGAGKTHLVARLLQEQSAIDSETQRYQCLWLGKPTRIETDQSLGWDEAWSQFILQKAELKPRASQPGSLTWRSLSEVDAFLRGETLDMFPSAKLVLIVDNVDEWIKLDPHFMVRWLEFLRSHTQLRSLMWVLCLSEANFSYVTQYDESWRSYGYGPDRIRSELSNWLSIDRFNTGSEDNDDETQTRPEYPVLKAILTAHLGEPSLIDEVLHLLEKTSLELLSNPYVAWMAAELIREDSRKMLYELPNLRFVDFVELFWNLRLKELTHTAKLSDPEGRSLQLELDELIRFITRALVASSQDEWMELRLVGELTSLFGGRNLLAREDVASQLIALLTEQDFLRTTEERYKLTLGFTPFWEYKGGELLREHMADPGWTIQQLRHEILKHLHRTDIAQWWLGFIEFLILLLDRKHSRSISESDNAVEDIALQIAEVVLEEVDKARSQVWLAAAKASPKYQNRLAVWFRNRPRHEFSGRDEFSHYLYFLKHAVMPDHEPDKDDETVDNEGVSGLLRTQLVHPYYRELSAWRLEGYFARFFLEGIPRTTKGGARLATTLAYLRGIEDHIDPTVMYHHMPSLAEIPVNQPSAHKWRILGSWAFRALKSRGISGDQYWQSLAGYVMTMVGKVAAIADSASVSSGFYERDRLWSQIVWHFCHDLVQEKGLTSLEFLQKYGWFSWSNSRGLPQLVLTPLDEQLSTAMGRWYRSNKNYAGVEKGYTDLLTSLVEADPDERKRTAFYLVYHTVPSYQPERKLSDNLWRLFNELWNDPSPALESAKAKEKLQNFYRIQASSH